jgi:hypothetical protein
MNMTTKEKEKLIVSQFCQDRGIMVTYCEHCCDWTVHCPDCNDNFCGGGCDCGYNAYMSRQQDKLIELLEEA